MSPLGILVIALAACVNGGLVPTPKRALAPFGPGEIRSSSEIDSQVVGGRDAVSMEFPHQASMQYVATGFLWFEDEPQHMCGGTLIHTSFVLTAAHCVLGVPSAAKRVEVVLGITNLNDQDGQRILVDKRIYHKSYDPYYNDGVGPYDIGLLKLATPATLSNSVKLAKLPQQDVYPTGNAVLSGWGSTAKSYNRPVYPDQLQTVTMPVIDFATCYDFITNSDPWSENPLLKASNLCVGDLKVAGLSACSGDSGGPLIQMQGSDAVVIGAVSWGLGDCASIAYPSVFTKVSGFVDWISRTIASYS